jgi:hypothetical protein
MFFKMMSASSSLKSLTLDQLESLSWSELLSHFNRLDSLSLTRCNLPIIAFLIDLRNKQVLIRSLDVSGNHTGRGMGPDFVFPASIENLVANDI